MPHRRGLGERAVDQRAETELGRLVLRGTLTADQGLAGETYLALWRGYVMSIAGPAELANAGGHGFTCDGCESEADRRHCRCSFRKRIFLEAYDVLGRAGNYARDVVFWVCVNDAMVLDEVGLNYLRLGLVALSQHFGLTARQNAIIEKHKIASILTESPK